ncbi:Bug family tripartite tricarboxylate transporter substrate binding protein [Variovorax sp. ZT5P49]|uniref:Bug family tripartite tricarboxylate transporter substrate binding protein n=1 Tax=Variovorax sp. ZT5P49 TaxID=3443733 RepID=UPI003F44ECA8
MGHRHFDSRRRTVLGLGAALMGAPLLHARAQDFPTRPISLVVPFPPGGGFDTIARPFADRLGKLLGQTVIVDNRPGSGGNMGTDIVARAPADGYTLLFANDYLATNPSVNRNVRYDPLKDFAPVSMIGTTQVVMAVRPDFPARNFDELVALSKQKSLSYGTPGAGTSPHLVGEYLSTISPLRSLHVPYKGTAPAVNDAMGGQIDMVYATSPSVATQIAAGKLRGLAVFGAQRSTQLPEVPTLREIGGPSVDYEVWYCLLAPAAVQAPVLSVVRDATRKALDADLAARLAKLGYAVKSSSPEEVTRVIQDGLQRWKGVVAQAKISIE